jgi:DNA-binding transcriptional LysR family regulator
MELRHLRYFVAVAEELHFRRAAQILHVAQPALSHQIKQLEEEIGAPLFHRGQHKIQLTAAGKVFYDKAQVILRDLTRAVRDVRAVEQGETGSISMGFVSTAAISILPNLLAHIREEMPTAEVVLKALAPNEQIDSLYRNTIDIGFFHAVLHEPAFDSLVVGRDRIMVALPKGNKLSRKKVIHLRDLAEETVIMPARHATVGYYESVRAAYQAAGIQPHRIHHSGQIQTGLLLVGAGLGVSLVPETWRSAQFAGVVYKPLSSNLAPFDLLAVWRRDNPSAVLRRVINSLPPVT